MCVMSQVTFNFPINFSHSNVKLMRIGYLLELKNLPLIIHYFIKFAKKEETLRYWWKDTDNHVDVVLEHCMIRVCK